MNKSNYNWFFYWVGCVVGGLVMGLVIGKDVSTTVEADLLAQAGYYPPASILPDPTYISSPSATPSPVTILFTGDVMLGRSVNQKIVSTGDPSWPFVDVAYLMKNSDITYINLENPLVSSCPITISGMKFCGDIKNVAGLVNSGVDVASLANNHSLNYGLDGLAETIEVLNGSGIAVVGTGDRVDITRKGSSYSFLSFNDIGIFNGISQANLSTMGAEIAKAKLPGVILIVTFHWGNEYQSNPTDRQVSMAHLAIDSGADAVIGAHPHWVQTSEIYGGKPIYYSLGNFVFDQEWSAETKRGLAVRLTYEGSVLTKTEELKVFIRNYGQPSWE